MHGGRTHLSVYDGHTGFEDRETHRGLSTPVDSLIPRPSGGQVRTTEGGEQSTGHHRGKNL